MTNRKKFRIWDTLAKIYPLPSQDYFGHYIITLDGRVYNLQNGSGGNELMLEQWTGLTDIEGVEIYEGDICILLHDDIDEEYEIKNNRFLIVYEYGCFCLKPISLSKPGMFPGVGGGNNSFTHLVYHDGFDENDNIIYRYELPMPKPVYNFGCMKVIGNKNENPELL